MPIKSLLERKKTLIAIVITIAIAIVSLISISGKGLGGIKIKNSDKIGHFIAYFILSISWFFAIKLNSKTRKQKILIILLLIFYGIIIEVLQEVLTTYRRGDLYDALANSTGVIMAALLFKKMNHFFNSTVK